MPCHSMCICIICYSQSERNKKVFKNELLRLPIVKSLPVNLKGSQEHTFRCCFQNACLTMLTRFCVVGALSWALLAILEHKTYFNCTI